jgi:hypothetical protein
MRSRLILSTLLIACTAVPVQAHFLFIRIAGADGKRHAEVYFSDRADAGDPEYIDNIAHTKLWLQQTPGKFEPLAVMKGEDRLTAALPAEGTLAVIGECVYGVLPRKTPFLLRHYPKTIGGDPKILATLRPSENVPMEILATVEKNGLRLRVLRNGKPFAQAPISTLAEDLSGERSLKADEKGEFFMKLPRPGYYTVYTSHFAKVKGKLADQAYEEIRDFATLSFQWPVTKE